MALDIWVTEHPRCGGTWLLRMLSDILRAELVSGINGDGSLDVQYWGEETKDNIYRVHKSHKLEKYGPTAFMIRDPRDMFVSAWHYSSKKLTLYEKISKYLLEDYFNENDNHYGRYESFMRIWLPMADVIVKYEDLHAKPFNLLDKTIYRLTGQRVSGERINNGIFNQSYNRIRARFPQLEHSVWRGQVGTWKEYFTHREADLVQAHIGDLMIELGYITTPDWVHDVEMKG